MSMVEYKCFSCGKTGSVIDFAMLIEKVDCIDAQPLERFVAVFFYFFRHFFQ